MTEKNQRQGAWDTPVPPEQKNSSHTASVNHFLSEHFCTDTFHLGLTPHEIFLFQITYGCVMKH